MFAERSVPWGASRCVATAYFCSGIGAVAWFNYVQPRMVEQLSLYETPPGKMRLWGRGFAVVWFAWSFFTTVKIPAFRRKRKFYVAFFPMYLSWLLSMPVAYAISESSELHYRRGINHVTAGIFSLLGHLGFMVLFNPKVQQDVPVCVRNERTREDSEERSSFSTRRNSNNKSAEGGASDGSSENDGSPPREGQLPPAVQWR